MKPRLLSRCLAALAALALLGSSIACVYPERAYWRHPGWRGPDFYRRY